MHVRFNFVENKLSKRELSFETCCERATELQVSCPEKVIEETCNQIKKGSIDYFPSTTSLRNFHNLQGAKCFKTSLVQIAICT